MIHSIGIIMLLCIVGLTVLVVFILVYNWVYRDKVDWEAKQILRKIKEDEDG